MTSFLSGQETLSSSCLALFKKAKNLPMSFSMRGTEDSNPQPRDLESRALPIELVPLLYLSMQCMLFAPLAVFPYLHPLGMLLLVFGCGIVPSFTLGACKHYDLSCLCSHLSHLTQRFWLQHPLPPSYHLPLWQT